jgi:hypothetical protein
VLNYDLYTRSPLDPEFNPDTDTISNGNVLAANTKVTIQASAVDDPHFTTFLGQHYDFQAVGEFELARSTAVGNLFQTQVRTRTQEAGTAGYTIISQAAALVGSQRVTFDVDHANDGGSILWIDGHPVSLSLNNPLILEGGSIVEFSPRQYEVLWNSGESLKVANDVVDHLNVTVALSLSDPLESLDGLLAADSCRTCDVLLPISSLAPEVLYGSFADAWRVTDTTSLFDYGACQTTATFTDKTYTFDLDATRYAQQTAAGCPLTLISGQQFDQLALPEPGTTALFSLGLLSLLIVNRHRKSPISSWRRSPRCWKPESVTHYRAVMVK